MSAQPKSPSIAFDASAHAYTLNGRAVPSVTQVLARFEDWSGIPQANLDFARARGQHVHEAMALLARDELDWGSLDEELLPYVEGGRRFLVESGVTVLGSEYVLGSSSLRVAGTLDLLGILRNAEGIFDFKVTAALPRTVGPQTAGYDLLLRDTFGKKKRKRYCVLLKPYDYRLVKLDDPTDENRFVSALNCYHFWGPSNAS